MERNLLKEKIRREARSLGFDLVGFAKAEHLTAQEKRLRNWLEKGAHGTMSYMANHFEKRVDPRLLVPGARSIISLAYNYYTSEKQEDASAPIISKYAYGEDYHFVIKSKLKTLLTHIESLVGNLSARVFVDSAPVLERDWAVRAGLGWMGKNTMLINPKKGSYFFLAEIISDLEVQADQSIVDHCGRCSRCIDACPTDAIAKEGYWMDGSKCISYLTIELRKEIPGKFKGKMENRVFGCDICQEVCPWNRFSTEHHEAAFFPTDQLLQMTKEDWEALTEEKFQILFRKSAVKRTKYKGLKRNIEFLSKEMKKE